MYERILDRVLARFFKIGALELTYPNGRITRYGEAAVAPVKVTIHSQDFIRGLLFNTDLTVGEGYMDGILTIEDDDLAGFLALLLKNRSSADGGLFRIMRQIRQLKRGLLLRNPIGKAQKNVAHHYDLSDALYDLFLDADRQYSCGYFTDQDISLDEAQAAKKHHIAAKLRLSPGQRVLDIGCGWGGMALTLARDYGVHVVGVTLSESQHRIATERVQSAGLQDQIDIRLQDYREVSETFDRIVSVGMFEHVGSPHYGEYFDRVHHLLAPGGVALIHTIANSGKPALTSPWITKYIFPGGQIPSLSQVAPYVEASGLVLTDLEVWRLHYAETLRHWYARFMERRDEAEALLDARFVRMWRYYLLASEMTFRYGAQIVFQIQIARTPVDLPLTRSYLYQSAKVTSATPTTADDD